MRRTRIVSTLGPASDSPEGIQALLEAGTDACRLNFSHGTRATHADVCRRLREVAARIGRTVAVLQDLAGPKIRVGPMTAPLLLAPGDRLAIEQGSFAGGPGRVSCAFEALFVSLPRGAQLLVDDGRIELEVTGASPGRIDTRVVTGGTLDSHKGINVPGVDLQTVAVTPKDVEDLRAGISMGVDLVAVSFVQSADDMRRARAAAADAGAPDLPLIAKIEKPQAVGRIDEILTESDGLMVARGDLGIEVPIETLPTIQHELIRAARRRGVPVIVATQVLESMRDAPRPTRAEVTDAAHAVGQGADAIMLAGETAIGRYPRLAVSTLDRVLREAEKSALLPEGDLPDIAGFSEHGRALCEAAIALASRAHAYAIVAVTEGGRTARMLSALRPRARILAVTANATTAARLALVWGVTPIVAGTPNLADVRKILRDRALVPAGAVVVFVSMDAALGRQDANFLHVETV
jgi:pyruvate kinase